MDTRRRLSKRYSDLAQLIFSYKVVGGMMIRKCVSSVFVALFVLLSGCSAFGSGINGNYEFGSQSDKGLVAISTHLVDACGHIDSFLANIYKSDGNGFPMGLPVKSLWKPDLPDNGYFFVLEFDKGSYTIGNILASGIGLVRTDASDMAEFRVDAGVVTYVGEIEFKVNIACTKVYTSVNDHWQRDSNFFKHRVTNIPPETIVTNLATTK